MSYNPYEVLGLDDNASEEEVKKARTELTKKYHPDRNPGFEDEANEKLKKINEAYEQIMSEKRSAKASQETASNDSEKEEPDSEETEVSTSTEEPSAEEQAEKKQQVMVPLKIVLLVGAVVLLAVALVGVVLMGMIRNELEPTSPVETTEPPLTIPADGDPGDVTCKGSYSVTADKLAQDTVVATVGDHKLTNGQLQVFYWMNVYDFINYYGYYLSYVGLDYTDPLDMQRCGITEENITWQQYFLGESLKLWQSYQLLTDMAEQEGWKLPEEYQTQLDGLEESLKKEAEEGDYESAEAMLAQQMGEGITVADYLYYVKLYYVANLYRDHLIATAEVTDDEIEAYFKEYETELKENSPSITKDSGLLVDVRHILIMPEGGTPSADGLSTTYSDAEWEACRQKAQAIYDQWLSGDKSQDSFSALANEKSEDQDGQVTNGGIYTDVYKGQMVEGFDDWCFDSARQPGDHGLVKTVYGYHIMYYVGGEEGWIRYSREGAQQEKFYAMESQLTKDNPVQTEYGKIAIAVVDLSEG